MTRSSIKDNLNEAAIESDTMVDILCRWRLEAARTDGGALPGKGLARMSEIDKENARLRKKLRDDLQKRDIRSLN